MNKVNYAVLVYAETQYKFVTKFVDNRMEWNDGEDAIQVSKTMAEMMATMLCLKDIVALVVAVPDYIEDLGNY